VAHQALTEYIAAAREKGHQDDRIERDLLDAGWSRKLVTAGLKPSDDLPVPTPGPEDAAEAPRAVVQALSTRGLEYIIMFIALAVSAISLGSILHSSVNTLFGSFDSALGSGGVVPVAASALLVSFPILAYLFLRLKRAELVNPSLRRDPSRKRAIQLTLVVTFMVGLGNVIYFVYSLMSGSQPDSYDTNAFGSSAANSIAGNFVHLLITLAIAGGIFYYYWRDEHQDD
jgi:hypothetical protein